MAKNKSKPIEPEMIEEAIEEVTEGISEEVALKVAEPIKETAEDINDAFITRTLKAINSMENPAKAKRLANRLLRKRR